MSSAATQHALSDLVRLGRPRLLRMELAAPWCVAVAGCEAPGMYMVHAGVARIDAFSVSARLEPGDCVLLPRGGGAHVVGDAQGTAALAPKVIADREASGAPHFVRLRGPGPRTLLSAVPFDTRPLAWAPRVVVLPRATQDAVTRSLIAAYERALEHDAADVLGRVAEALWVRAIGARVREEGRVDVDVLRAASRVLEAPTAAHDLESLARSAGISRARFCARFTAAFGVAPMRWVRGVRLAHAERLLAEGRTIADVAEILGYSDESAFRKARRRVRAGASRR